jgi:ABC-type lipoprotein export system ATPase subunit
MSKQAEADRPVIIEVENLKRHYTRGKQTVEALRGVSFKIQKGEFVSIMGPSGSGKSTLLHLMGGLDRPSSGRVKVGGRFIDELGDKQLSEFRRRSLGFVFQFFKKCFKKKSFRKLFILNLIFFIFSILKSDELFLSW